MIAIFLNELVNITSSYLKINYYRDVSEYNIRNNCNNIFCEAETARFNLAKNSYKLILPNDNFNSKIYYYALLFIFVTVFLMMLYKFWDYNKKAVEYYSDVDGGLFISYLFMFPYLFTFAIVAMLTVMIARRYAPTDSKGYQEYFVIDNNKFVNINTILDYSKKVIIGLVVIWFVFSMFSNIPRNPSNNFKYGTNLWYISLVYLVALTIILNYMIILSNIAFTFNDSTTVDLDKNSLINNLRDKVLKLKVISKDQLINSLAIELDKKFTDNTIIRHIHNRNKADVQPSSLPLFYNKDDSIVEKKYGKTIVVINNDNINNKYKPLIKYYLIKNVVKEFYAENTDTPDNKNASFAIGGDKLNEIKVIHRYIDNVLTTSSESESYITKINNDFNNLKLENLINYLTGKNIDEQNYDKQNNYPSDFNLLKAFFLDDNANDVQNLYKNADKQETNINYKLIKIICDFTKYIILSFLKKNINKNEVNYEECLKMFKLFNYIDDLNDKYSKIPYVNADDRDNFIFEYTIYLEVYNDNSIKDKAGINNKINKLIYDHYTEYFATKKPDKVKGLKLITNKCHNLINHNNLNVDFNYNDAKIFNQNISDVFNSNDKLNADTSYNSENTYYQKYFNIAGEDNLSQKYNIGNYDYKNIEEFLSSLFLYVIFFIVFTFIIMFLQSDMEDYSPFEILGREIVTPFVGLFIVVLFIYIFVNFNTKYNLYFIYGVLDSFYKRDLLQYNNIITPFIRLHDNNVENSRDYTKHYIITNVFASIISNFLNLHNIAYDNNDDFIDAATTATSPSYKVSDNVTEISDNFTELSDNTFLTTYAEYFKYISDYNEFKKYNSDIYENIKSNYFNVHFNAATPEKIYNFIHNLDKILEVSKLTTKESVSSYIKKFIEKYIDIILRIVIECEYILTNDEFNSDKFDKIKKYFYFYEEGSDNKSIPYKFIIKLKTKKDFNDFIERSNKTELKELFDGQRIITQDEDDEYKILDYNYDKNNKLTYADIIANFLKIVSHLKYNYEFLNIGHTKTALKEYTDNPDTDDDTDISISYSEYITRIHKFHNMRLLYLITDHTPTSPSMELIEDITEINDTFKNTIGKTNFKNDNFHPYFMNLKFICNLLEDYDSESGIENINSNYLKNVIKTTYKQINEENIRFIDRGKYANDYNTDYNYNISPIVNYSTKSDSIKNITNNANYFTGHGILFNYFANAVLILVIYNLGYN